jgi:hypothetical protein
MRQKLAAVGAAALMAAGCSTGSTAECAAIADDAIVLLQGFVDEVDALNEAGEGERVFDPEFVARLEDDAAALDDRSASAGCTEQQMADLLSERSDLLTATTSGGQAMVELMLTDQFFNP